MFIIITIWLPNRSKAFHIIARFHLNEIRHYKGFHQFWLIENICRTKFYLICNSCVTRWVKDFGDLIIDITIKLEIWCTTNNRKQHSIQIYRKTYYFLTIALLSSTVHLFRFWSLDLLFGNYFSQMNIYASWSNNLMIKTTGLKST